MCPSGLYDTSDCVGQLQKMPTLGHGLRHERTTLYIWQIPSTPFMSELSLSAL